MSRQWIRGYKLTVGSTVITDPFHMEFFVRQQTRSTPNSAEIRVFNLSADTVAKVTKPDQSVLLEVGYDGDLAAIFKGNVKVANKGRASPVDTIVDLYCGDGDQAYIKASLAKTVAAGRTQKDVVQECIRAMQPFGITEGFLTAGLSVAKLIRPITLHGLARDALHTVAASFNATWSIQNGKLNLLKKTEALPGGDHVVNSSTGMIGRPTQTTDGIIIRTLLNPRMQCDHIVRVDEASIDRAAPNLGYSGVDLAYYKLPSIAADGRYRVYGIDRVGAQEGREWYDTLYCANASDQQTYLPKRLIEFTQ